MAKNTNPLTSKVHIPMDGKTGMLFAQLLSHGIAKLNVDKDVPENEIHASVEHDENGSPNLVLHMHGAFFIVPA